MRGKRRGKRDSALVRPLLGPALGSTRLVGRARARRVHGTVGLLDAPALMPRAVECLRGEWRFTRGTCRTACIGSAKVAQRGGVACVDRFRGAPGAAWDSAMITNWNDAEDEALRRVTWMARLVYLQGIRRRMDYSTGIAGERWVISYQQLSEVLDCTEHTTAPDPKATKRMLQRAFEALERAGLVRWIRAEGPRRGIVFHCLLADRDQSVQKQAVPKRYPSGTQRAVPDEPSNYAEPGPEVVPTNAATAHRQAVPPPEDPVSGKKESSSNSCSPGANDAAREAARGILEALNRQAGTSYKATGPDGKPSKAIELIRYRLREHSEDELLAMVGKKCREWGQDDRMRQYLRPATLFGREKCEQYVGQLALPSKSIDRRRLAIDDFLGGPDGCVIEGEFRRDRIG